MCRRRNSGPHSEPYTTGTDNHSADSQNSAQRQAQRAERETKRLGANGCAADSDRPAQKKSPKPLQIADLSDGVRRPAGHPESSGGGISPFRISAAKNRGSKTPLSKKAHPTPTKHPVPTQLAEIWEQLDRAERRKLEQVICEVLGRK